jgi:hypothetical protein
MLDLDNGAEPTLPRPAVNSLTPMVPIYRRREGVRKGVAELQRTRDLLRAEQEDLGSSIAGPGGRGRRTAGLPAHAH